MKLDKCLLTLLEYLNPSFQQASFYLCHRWARCILADSDRRAPHSPKGDTLHSRSAAPCRPEAPAGDHSTDPGSLRCTCNCRSLRLGHTDRENIWSEGWQKVRTIEHLWRGVCFICAFFPTVMWLIQSFVLLPAAGLPIVQTGIRSCHLGTENPVVFRRAITRYSGLSSLSTRSLGTDTAGVTTCKNTIALVMEENWEKCSY